MSNLDPPEGPPLVVWHQYGWIRIGDNRDPNVTAYVMATLTRKQALDLAMKLLHSLGIGLEIRESGGSIPPAAPLPSSGLDPKVAHEAPVLNKSGGSFTSASCRMGDHGPCGLGVCRCRCHLGATDDVAWECLCGAIFIQAPDTPTPGECPICQRKVFARQP